jgi:hypothetical protein
MQTNARIVPTSTPSIRAEPTNKTVEAINIKIKVINKIM